LPVIGFVKATNIKVILIPKILIKYFIIKLF
jgi:hypothetical protein